MSQTAGDKGFSFFMNSVNLSDIEERCQCRSGLLIISRGTAILLLFVYIAYLIFQLKTHAYLFQPEDEGEPEELEMSILAAGTALLFVTVVTAFAADYRE